MLILTCFFRGLVALSHLKYKFILVGEMQCTWNPNGRIGGMLSRARVMCHFEETHVPRTTCGTACDVTRRLAQVVHPTLFIYNIACLA